MKAPSKKKAVSKRPQRQKDLITLKGVHSIGSAAQLRDKLIQGLAVSKKLTIDTRAIESIDLGSLQVLTAAQRSAEARGQELLIIAPETSAAFKLAQSCGFFDPSGRPLLPEVSGWTRSQDAAS